MGLFSAIGSFFGPVGTIFGALADTSIAKKQQKQANAAAEAAYKRQLAQDEKNRQLAKQDAANKFVDMNAAAKKAGINPLTALRATGGAGFGMYGGMTAVAPVLSRFNFATTFAKNVGQVFLDKKQNEPIDAYNRELRKLELEQRRLDIKLAKQTLTGMTQNSGGGMPKVPKNVMEGYSLGMKNEYLAKHGLNVTTYTGGTPTEIAVDSRGNTYRKPAGEDFDEQLLNSVYHGVQQLRYGVLDAWNWMTKGQRPPDMPMPTLNPNVPIIGTFESNGKLVMGPNFRDRFGVGAPYYNY